MTSLEQRFARIANYVDKDGANIKTAVQVFQNVIATSGFTSSQCWRMWRKYNKARGAK